MDGMARTEAVELKCALVVFLDKRRMCLPFWMDEVNHDYYS
jgi:hypothetical protein